jgi:aminopeptidase N
VPNYELEAAGLGMWRVGQELLTEPYVDRYFDELPDTVDVRHGWVLATGALAFFPITSLTDKTATRARELIEAGDADPTLRRTVVDRADDLGRRMAVRQAYPGR